VASFVSVPARRGPRHGDGWWETVRYALDSNLRTIRLCLIVLVASLSLAVGVAAAVLVRHVLMMLLT
jgi:hypothetical protein